jgi:hypothetical protein
MQEQHWAIPEVENPLPLGSQGKIQKFGDIT